jgi:hypothetical protein
LFEPSGEEFYITSIEESDDEIWFTKWLDLCCVWRWIPTRYWR